MHFRGNNPSKIDFALNIINILFYNLDFLKEISWGHFLDTFNTKHNVKWLFKDVKSKIEKSSSVKCTGKAENDPTDPCYALIKLLVQMLDPTVKV
jgi:hypothetical protein